MLGTTNISSFLRTLFFFVLIASFFNTLAVSIGFGFPYNTFLFMPEDLYADFFKVMDALDIAETWPGTNEYGKIGINHIPPFATSVYVSMALLIKNFQVSKELTFLLVFIIPLVVLLGQSSSFTNKSKYWFLILFTYPILIVLNRGNVAILVFTSLAFFILRIKNIFLSMLCLAIATSLKITPVIFIVYFLVYYIDNWKKILLGLISFGLFILIINYLSVIFVSTTVSANIYNPIKLFDSIRRYEAMYVEQFGGLRYGSSFYMAFRYIVNLLNDRTHLHFFAILLYIKPLIINSFVLIVLLVGYLWKFSVEHLKLLLQDRNTILKVICIIFVLFTPVTGDYYLTILLLPLFFIPLEQFTLPEKVFYLLVLSPKNYFFYHFISLQVFINPLLLLAMLIAATRLYNFRLSRSRNQLTTDLSY